MVQRKVLIILSLDIVVFIRRDCNYSRVCEKREKERERERENDKNNIADQQKFFQNYHRRNVNDDKITTLHKLQRIFQTK